MTDTTTVSDRHLHFARLARTRVATRAAIIVERLWPLVLPVILVVAVFASLAWFGVLRLLPDVARLGLSVAFALAALAALYPLRRFRAPSIAEIDRRIEAANRLQHNPVSVQSDRLAERPGAFADALWREHQRRMAERLASVRGDLPRTHIPDRDPLALRAAVALLFVVAFAFSFSPFGGSVLDAMRPQARADVIPPRIDAWVTPPAYTGKAPILLTTNGTANPVFTVPTGSDVSLRVTGGAGDETLSYTEASGNEREIAANAPVAAAKAQANGAQAATRQFAGKLTTDGTLTLKSGDQDVQSWAFSIIPDKPPTIEFTGEPKRALNGTLELDYKIVDDYGATSATTEFALADAPAEDASPLYKAPEMPLALPRRDTRDGAAKTTRDLTEHAWAGAKVKVTLHAVDAAGQQGKSQTKIITLPERPFSNPLARAVIEQRRLLALDGHSKPRVLALLDGITLRPEETFADNLSHYLAIVSARTRLKIAASDDALRDEVSYLWQIALGIEEGDLSIAEKRLRQAQQNLKDALQRGASDEEIDKAMKELRQAMNEYLRELAERADKNPNLAEQLQQGQELRQSDIDKLMDQIENLAKSGNKDQAEQLLSQLEEMMNNLQAGRGQQQGQNGQQSQMRKQMNKLGEIMRRQQEMMNDTFRMEQMQRGQGQQDQDGQDQLGQDQGQQGGENRGQNNQGMSEQDFADALKQLQQGQGQLRGDLQQLMQDLQSLGIKPNQGFGEAGEAMGQAETALGEGQGDEAVGQQGRALDALRNGAKDMMQQMQQAMRGDQGGTGERGQRNGAERDPLGRPWSSTNPDPGNSVKVPDAIDVQRARQILDAIRKRLGNSLSPQIERDYLERLLELK
jgi:uncharacterized protein (TIGR02302 family)